MKQFRRIAIMFFCISLMMTTVVSAEESYEGYNYDYWGEVTPSPVPYAPSGTITGESLGLDSFKNPADLYISDAGDFYLLDSGNNRIVIFNQDLELIRVIAEFDHQGVLDTFNNPQGITVSSKGDIYVADTDNTRVVQMDQEGNLVSILENPQSELFDPDFSFRPSKVAVDDADRLYVIVKNVFEGIMCFSEEGAFISYFGTIDVRYNVTDMIWRKIATKEQRDKMILFIPTEYTNMDMDEEGFVYATNVDYSSDQTISRLNPSGKDVIKKYATGVWGIPRQIVGDLVYRAMGILSGPSTFADIKSHASGIYSALDTNRGRIFTYDHEGNLLYIFGGIGEQLGLFKKPVAIEAIDDTMYVLDETRHQITVFDATEYGALINEATRLRFDGDEAQAVEVWKEVLKLDANYELAYSGIGKSLLAAGKNKEAMEYLKLGMDKKYYSVAFKRYRVEVMKEKIDFVFTGIIVLIIAAVVRNRYRKKRKGNKEYA